VQRERARSNVRERAQPESASANVRPPVRALSQTGASDSSNEQRGEKEETRDK